MQMRKVRESHISRYTHPVKMYTKKYSHCEWCDVRSLVRPRHRVYSLHKLGIVVLYTWKEFFSFLALMKSICRLYHLLGLWLCDVRFCPHFSFLWILLNACICNYIAKPKQLLYGKLGYKTVNIILN